jgi:hypothetical protein
VSAQRERPGYLAPVLAAGISLFAVPGPAAGLVRVPLPAMDQTRKQARLDFVPQRSRY